MTQLTPLQQRFVENLTVHPLSTPKEVLFISGYKGSDHACQKASQRMRANPVILDAIKEVATARLGYMVPKATEALENMVTDPQHPSHYKAVDGLLNRVGLHQVSESRTVIEHKVDACELITRIRAMTAVLGIDVRGIERLQAPVSDGDTVEVIEVAEDTD
jgi:hypothetical protein